MLGIDQLLAIQQPAAAAPVVPEAQQTDGGLAGSMAGSLTPAADGVAPEPEVLPE